MSWVSEPWETSSVSAVTVAHSLKTHESALEWPTTVTSEPSELKLIADFTHTPHNQWPIVGESFLTTKASMLMLQKAADSLMWRWINNEIKKFMNGDKNPTALNETSKSTQCSVSQLQFYLFPDGGGVQRESSCGHRCSGSSTRTAGTRPALWCHWELLPLCWCYLHYKL